MAKAPNTFLLVQVASSCFHAPDGLHFFVVLESVIPGEGDMGAGAIIQLMEFEWLDIKRSLGVQVVLGVSEDR